MSRETTLSYVKTKIDEGITMMRKVFCKEHIGLTNLYNALELVVATTNLANGPCKHRGTIRVKVTSCLLKIRCVD